MGYGGPGEAFASGRRRSGGLRDHQHFDRLAGLERKAVQKRFAMLLTRRVTPMCLHAHSIKGCGHEVCCHALDLAGPGPELVLGPSGCSAVVPSVIGVWRDRCDYWTEGLLSPGIRITGTRFHRGLVAGGVMRKRDRKSTRLNSS